MKFNSKSFIIWILILALYTVIIVNLPEWILDVFEYERYLFMGIWIILFAISCYKGTSE